MTLMERVESNWEMVHDSMDDESLKSTSRKLHHENRLSFYDEVEI